MVNDVLRAWHLPAGPQLRSISLSVKRYVAPWLLGAGHGGLLNTRRQPFLPLIFGVLAGKFLEMPGNTVEGASENINRTYDVDAWPVREGGA